MKIPDNVAPMPAEQRAELKRLAEAATPGLWRCEVAEDGCEIVATAANEICYAGNSLRAQEDAAYIAAVSPGVTLATLAYVEALETQLQQAQQQLAGARQELAEQEVEKLALVQENKQLRTSLGGWTAGLSDDDEREAEADELAQEAAVGGEGSRQEGGAR